MFTVVVDSRIPRAIVAWHQRRGSSGRNRSARGRVLDGTVFSRERSHGLARRAGVVWAPQIRRPVLGCC